MANKTVWLANENDYPTYKDAYTFRDRTTNPTGLRKVTQVSGNNVKILSSVDVKYGVNSLAVAEKNSQKIQSLIDALPDSGGAIGISNDLFLTTLTFPTRTIGGIPGQPIPFRLFGTRPGVMLYGLSEEPLINVSTGASGVVHTPTRHVRQEICDLGITCRGTGIKCVDAGYYFSANNVEINSENGPAWHFVACYGMNLGAVSAMNGHNATGFLFDSCIHVNFVYLTARGNRNGVIVQNTRGHRSGNFFGQWDCEGNSEWQVKLNGLQKSLLCLYMEQGNRISLKNCENLDFVGDGFRVDEIDESSLLLNPDLFDIQLVSVYAGTPVATDDTHPVTRTGLYSWTYDSNGISPAHHVKVAPAFEQVKTAGKVYDIRFRARGKGKGWLSWYTASDYKQSIEVELTDNWRTYAFEREVCPADGSQLLWSWPEGGHQVEFELLHVAEVVARTDYC